MGNIFIPMLNKTLPYLIALTKAVRKVAQSIAEFFGFAMPEIDYSGLQNIAGGAEDAENKLNGATGAAGKLKKMLLGIDELNVLPSKDSGSGSGASSDGWKDFELPEYDFISNAINSRVDKIFNKLKPEIEWVEKHFKDILEVVTSVGIGMLSWKVSKSLENMISSIGSGSGIGSELKKEIGITLMVSGISLDFIGSYEIGLEGPNVKNVIKSALGSALGIAGSLLAFGAGPVGWAVGIGASISVTIMGIMIGSDQRAVNDFYNTSLGKELAKIKSEIEERADIRLNLDAKIDSISAEIPPETLAKLDTAKKLISEIFELDAKDNKTAAEIEIINQKILTLNGLHIDGISDRFQALGDDYVIPARKEVDSLMESILNEAKVEAVRGSLVKSWEAYYEAVYKSKDAMLALESAQESYDRIAEMSGLTEYKNSMQNLYSLLKDVGVQYGETGWQAKFLNSATEEQKEQFYALTSELDGLRKSVGKYKAEIGEAEKALALAKEENEKWSKTLGNAKEKAESMETALEKLTGSAKNAKESGSDFAEKWKSGFESGISDLGDLVRRSIGNPNSANGKYAMVPIYADGGFPGEGQMFVAREAGPEMVGTIGGRTAVANNDQIVSAVSAGVYSAVRDAMRESSGDQHTTVNVDGDALFDFVVSKNRRQSVVNGYSPLLG